MSAIAVGELLRGVERLRHRGDLPQAQTLERWLRGVLRQYEGKILAVDEEIGGLWGTLRARHPEPAVDRLIAATAIYHGLTVVKRNVRDFEQTGVEMLSPFD
ncbi:type II toxin-antitoxin system VapC family toxin [Caballeronia hypogeia]|uniref:type II toxin-antitoxin system VapC family toxin n=1 Tax=Caballeronia hypogeia TaxID=1777140 RepID=UPI0007728150|nr:type II toxin-antitoxin system VapC family toxin [Caballeronia hypogeia]